MGNGVRIGGFKCIGLAIGAGMAMKVMVRPAERQFNVEAVATFWAKTFWAKPAV
jgi:hypothetical protein